MSLVVFLPYKTEAPPSVLSRSFSFRHPKMLCHRPDGATSLLSETKLHRLLRHDVGVIQLSTDTVRVERQNGASSLLTTDISIRGLAVQLLKTRSAYAEKTRVSKKGAFLSQVSLSLSRSVYFR